MKKHQQYVAKKNQSADRVQAFFAVFCLGFGLAAMPWLPPVAQAADIAVSGGSGGGGGGGNGAYQYTLGGGIANHGGGGGNGGSSSGGGVGGGASRIDGTSNASRDGANSTNTNGGAGGTAVESGETAGTTGSNASGNIGGAGGNGASAAHTSSAATADNIYVYGGNGGRGGQGGTVSGYDGGVGGNGGDAALILSGNMAVSGNVFVQSGRGGDGARDPNGSGASGAGGTGGDASLSISGALTANMVIVTSGAKGETDGIGSLNLGAGGEVGFFATSLAAPRIYLSKNTDSNLAFKVGTLDVTRGDTTLTLYQTTAGTSGTAMNGDGVYIGTARRGDGQLIITESYFSFGNASIGTLQLEGRGAFYDALNYATADNLTVDGGTLHNGNWSGLIDHAYTTSAITLGVGGATVELGAGEDKTLSRVLIGSGALTKTGSGVLTLSGANTYTGATTITAGTVIVGNYSAFGTGSVTMSAGTSLGFDLDNAANPNNSTPLLHIASTLDLTGVNVELYATANNFSAYTVGDSILLIDSAGGSLANTSATTVNALAGATTYNFDLSLSSANLTALYQGINAGATTSNAKVYAEGKATGLAGLNVASDLVDNQGYKRAAEATAGLNQWTGWFGLGGGREKVETGSHIDTDYFGLLGGVAREFEHGDSTTAAGFFLEGGWGDYSTYNSLPAGSVRGDGNTDYFGAGIMMKEEKKNGLYYEGALRAGRVRSDFGTNDLGAGAGYHTSSAYFGAQFGLGKVVTVKSGGLLDAYLKAFYTRQGSDRATTRAGEQLSFEAAHSFRMRIGARHSKSISQKASWYAGLAGEYEFAGKLGSQINGAAVEKTDMSGFSALLELGYTINVSDKWSVDLAAQGLAGKREGVGGSVNFSYKF